MISCKISGVVYNLAVLLTQSDKQKGLKQYNSLPINQGVIFVYDDNVDLKYDFSEISYGCRIYFLDSNFKMMHQESTYPYQKELVGCPKSFRYVIETGK